LRGRGLAVSLVLCASEFGFAPLLCVLFHSPTQSTDHRSFATALLPPFTHQHNPSITSLYRFQLKAGPSLLTSSLVIFYLFHHPHFNHLPASLQTIQIQSKNQVQSLLHAKVAVFVPPLTRHQI
jgi:hypothetical protein